MALVVGRGGGCVVGGGGCVGGGGRREGRGFGVGGRLVM